MNSEAGSAVLAVGAIAGVGVLLYNIFKSSNDSSNGSNQGFTKLYTIGQRLGRGAFGEVFKVKKKSDGRWYAMKIINTATGVLLVDDIRMELALMKQLEHPNIVKYYEAYSFNSKVGIIMQLGSKGDLHRYICERKELAIEKAVLNAWMDQLCSAFQYIHGADAMHRDLKPANILINNNGSILVADFGLAKIMTSSYASSVCGTSLFCAPEVMSGRGYDWKCDIYSLGCVFLCLLTCKPRPEKTSARFEAIRATYGHEMFNIVATSLSPNKNQRRSAMEIGNSLVKCVW